MLKVKWQLKNLMSNEIKNNVKPMLLFGGIYLFFSYIVDFTPLAYLGIFIFLLFGAKFIIVGLITFFTYNRNDRQKKSLFEQRLTEMESNELVGEVGGFKIIGSIELLTGDDVLSFMNNAGQRDKMCDFLRIMLENDFPSTNIPEKDKLIEGIEVLDETSVIVYLNGEIGTSISPVYSGSWRY